MIYNGIDLSKHNKVTSWDDVKNKNKIDFVILRAGGHWGRFYKDPKFELYYNACKVYNIPVGAYYDCGKEFITADFGKECAQHFMNLLSGKVLEMPVFMDIEVTPKRFKKQITDAAVSFCRTLEANNYFVGIYASDISGFKESLEYDRITMFTKWVARYGKEPSYVKSWNIWQMQSDGIVRGIQGNVDFDTTNTNYPFIMKRGHFNGN